MFSDSNKRRGWKKGERKIEEKRQVCLCKQPQEEEEKQLRFSLSILISCVDFHKMGIILNHVSPLLLDWHGLTIRFHY